MMPYVQRDATKKVTGLYALSQPGYAEEFLPDTSPEVVSYLSPALLPKLPTVQNVIDVLKAKNVITATDLASVMAL